MVVSTLSCEFCGVLVVSFWGFWKHQPSQFPSLMPHSRKSSLHVPGWLLQTLVGWRGSCGSEHRCLREGVGPNCLWVKQRVEGVQFSYFLKDGLVFSDWKMMGCWLCIVFIYIYISICCFRLVQCSSWRFGRDLPSWQGPLFQMGGSTTATYSFILLAWVRSCGHAVTLLLGRSSIKDDMDFFQRNGG